MAGNDEISWPVREAISKVERTVSDLTTEMKLMRQRAEDRQERHEAICENDKAEQERWRNVVDKRLEEMLDKMETMAGDLRQALQAGLSVNNVAIADLGRDVKAIELAQARQQGQFRGGLAVIGGIAGIGSAIGGIVTFIGTWVTGHLK